MENLGIKNQNKENKRKNEDNRKKENGIHLNNIHVKSNLLKINNLLKPDGDLSENNDVRSRILEEKSRKRTALLEYELDRMKSSNFEEII